MAGKRLICYKFQVCSFPRSAVVPIGLNPSILCFAISTFMSITLEFAHSRRTNPTRQLTIFTQLFGVRHIWLIFLRHGQLRSCLRPGYEKLSASIWGSMLAAHWLCVNEYFVWMHLNHMHNFLTILQHTFNGNILCFHSRKCIHASKIMNRGCPNCILHQKKLINLLNMLKLVD